MRDTDSTTGTSPVAETAGVFVTTSWDDGHVLDHKVAELMREHGLHGTFYIAPHNVELTGRERLSDAEIVSLASEFEIGGHTLTHQRLSALPDATAKEEIVAGKDALEQILGQRLRSFCYPGGEYSQQHPDMVRDAGFGLARTVRRGVTGWTPQFETDTTVHAYRHLVDAPYALRLAGRRPAKAVDIYWNWDVLAMAVFDRVMAHGGVFHLWGHSWEIDRNRDWERLERVLRYIGGRRGVNYIDNGDLATVAR